MLMTGPIRGDFPSLKLGRMVRYGSTIERDLLYFLEYWQTVTWYREQPMTIEYTMPDGGFRRYTPDYEIHEGAIKTLAECKPEARLKTRRAQQQRQIGQLWAKTNGYHFVTFTDIELRSGHQLANLKLFWRYARLRDSSLHYRVLEQVAQGVTCSIDALCQELGEPLETMFPTVCNLLFHQQLQVDLNLPFTTAVPLQMARG